MKYKNTRKKMCYFFNEFNLKELKYCSIYTEIFIYTHIFSLSVKIMWVFLIFNTSADRYVKKRNMKKNIGVKIWKNNLL